MSYYGTLAEADAYFENRLFSELWANTPVKDRTNALNRATQDIDRLNFVGKKHAAYTQWLATPCDQEAILAASATQELQFPRGTDTEVPEDIKKACFEIAFELVDGKNPDEEYQKLTTVSEGFSSVRRTYNRSFAQEHVLYGIASPIAWRYLKPYVRDGLNITLSRV